MRIFDNLLFRLSVPIIGVSIFISAWLYVMLSPKEGATIVATLIGPMIAIFAVLLQQEMINRKEYSDAIQGLKDEITSNIQKKHEFLMIIQVHKDKLNGLAQPGNKIVIPLNYMFFEKSAFLNFQSNGYLSRLDKKDWENVVFLYHMVDAINEYTKRDFELICMPLNAGFIKHNLEENLNTLNEAIKKYEYFFEELSKNNFFK